MNQREKMELEINLISRKLVKNKKEIESSSISEEDSLDEFTPITKEIGDDKRHVLNQNESRQIRSEGFEMITHDYIEHNRELCDWEDNDKLNELLLPKQGKQINPKD